MCKSHSKNYRKQELDEVSLQLNVIQIGRLATILFIIGCFLNFIEYDKSEKAIFQAMDDATKNLSTDNELQASRIAEVVSVIFLIAISMYTSNALTTLKLRLDKSNLSSNQGWRFIAFFDLVKVMSYAGAAIGYYIATQELEEYQS
ncbi:hypothetical protein CHL78_005005 [Romboutsia weinsteinii]|uniref:DUF2975 domain-containing protein n=1 Tax=Romboutsia weinsteinii TaxID=2020949 RepID=A0A371J7A1_9FIRM|nr:hypothetical protein [Romboutsia weinsteinii]RDY28547.1 hypothetical protein CHL78_005005 [Romboutsia weinsteinii]